MSVDCQHINYIFELSLAEGNTIIETSKWTKIKKVIHMQSPLSVSLRNKIDSEIEELAYRKTEKTPFYPSHESFACFECSVAVEFPL